MHAHGVEVFNGADDDDVVRQVAHHLQLEFLPAQHAFLDQAFMHRRKVESASQNLHQLFAVVGDAAARSAQREARPDEHRKTQLAGEIQPVAQIVHQSRARHFQADTDHRVLEEQPVLGFFNGFELGPDQLHVVAVEHARIGEIHGEIERRLPANRRQQRKLAGPFA